MACVKNQCNHIPYEQNKNNKPNIKIPSNKIPKHLKMYKYKGATKDTLRLLGRYTHDSINKETAVSNYPIAENLVNGVTYPFYQLRAIGPEYYNVVLKYFRNNYFQSDPLIRTYSLSGFHQSIEKLLIEKLHNSMCVMAVSACPEQTVLGVAIASSATAIDKDILTRLAKATTDSSLQRYLEYLAHFKYLNDISQNPEHRVWELNLLSTDTTARGHGIAQMLMKQAFVMGKERGHRYARVDCTNSLYAILSKRLQLRLMWVVEFKDFSNYYLEAMRGCLCPHTGLSVYVEDLQSRKMAKFERDVLDFNERCRTQLIQYH